MSRCTEESCVIIGLWFTYLKTEPDEAGILGLSCSVPILSKRLIFGVGFCCEVTSNVITIVGLQKLNTRFGIFSGSGFQPWFSRRNST